MTSKEALQILIDMNKSGDKQYLYDAISKELSLKDDFPCLGCNIIGDVCKGCKKRNKEVK